MTKEYRFVGGPYNGNSFNVPENSQDYSITSHSGRYAVQHVYVLQGAVFVYECNIPLIVG